MQRGPRCPRYAQARRVLGVLCLFLTDCLDIAFTDILHGKLVILCLFVGAAHNREYTARNNLHCRTKNQVAAGTSHYSDQWFRCSYDLGDAISFEYVVSVWQGSARERRSCVQMGALVISLADRTQISKRISNNLLQASEENGKRPGSVPQHSRNS